LKKRCAGRQNLALAKSSRHPTPRGRMGDSSPASAKPAAHVRAGRVRGGPGDRLPRSGGIDAYRTDGATRSGQGGQAQAGDPPRTPTSASTFRTGGGPRPSAPRRKCRPFAQQTKTAWPVRRPAGPGSGAGTMAAVVVGGWRQWRTSARREMAARAMCGAVRIGAECTAGTGGPGDARSATRSAPPRRPAFSDGPGRYTAATARGAKSGPMSRRRSRGDPQRTPARRARRMDAPFPYCCRRGYPPGPWRYFTVPGATTHRHTT